MLAAVFALLSFSHAVAQDKNDAQAKAAAELLPESTIAFAELKNVDQIVGMILEHPLRAKVESLDEVKQAFASDEYKQFRFGLSLIEGNLGKPWREALAELTSGGVYVAFDPATEGAVVLIRAENEQAPQKAIDVFLTMARADARGKDKPDPIKSTEYRGLKAYGVEEAKFARLGNWLMITNKGDLAKSIADAHLDGAAQSLAANTRFQQALAARPAEPQVWGFLDINTIRESGEAEAFYREQTDNPGVELLVGGIVSTMRETPFATFTTWLQPNRLEVAVAAPHDPAWVPEQRDFYFGPEGKGRAPKPLQLDNTLFTLTTYRNVGEMWLRAGDLFDEGVNDEIAKAEAQLSTLFSGKDVGEDILGALQPEMQLIVTEQDFTGVMPQPAIKLPSFAVIARLKDPEKMRPELRRTFQSLIGFLNVVGAMQGQPQLDLDQEKDGEKLIVSSKYAAEDDEKESTAARINFNFSPTVAFNKDVFVLSSTTELASRIADRADESQELSDDNTLAQANISALRSVLAANREHLIAQNMLEDGNSREEAEEQIAVLMQILRVFDNATLRLTPADESLRLSVEVRLRDDLD